MKVNVDAIKSKKEELEKSNEYLPKLIREEIDYWDWIQFLEKNENNDVLEKVRIARHERKSSDELMEELKIFVEKHPEYKEFIIWVINLMLNIYKHKKK